MAVQRDLGQKFGELRFSYPHPFHESFSDADFDSSRRVVAERVKHEKETTSDDRELPNEKEVERVDPKELDREIGEPKRMPKTAKAMGWSMMLLGNCPEYGASFA